MSKSHYHATIKTERFQDADGGHSLRTPEMGVTMRRPDATIVRLAKSSIEIKIVMKHLRMQDQVGSTQAAAPDALSPTGFSGTWLNTNPDNPGITCVTCKAEGKVLRVRFEGNGSSEPSDWGEATAELLCAASIHGGPAMSFVTSFDLGFKNVRVGGNLNQGLLVIATFHSWQNHSGVGRSNYFSREFFNRVDQS